MLIQFFELTLILWSSSLPGLSLESFYVYKLKILIIHLCENFGINILLCVDKNSPTVILLLEL